MQKDIIYIEPEEDITDILGRIKQSSQRIIALVPPKKIGVLRSAVNVKLIAKAASVSDKAVVFVTTDLSLMKLAAANGLPVAKTLQSRPVIPTLADTEQMNDGAEQIDDSAEQMVEESAKAAPVKTGNKTPKTQAAPRKKEQTLAPADLQDSDLDIDEESLNSSKKKAKLAHKIPNFNKQRKLILAGAIGGVALVAFLVWAIIFAPAAQITVAIRTTTNNFSENITFTKDQQAIKPKKGVFLLEEQKYEKKSNTKFTATGKKDVGEKASGTLTVTYHFSLDDKGSSQTLPAGSRLTYNGLNYFTATAATVSWDGDSLNQCPQPRNGYCRRSTKVKVSAEGPGEKYNIGAHNSGWASSVSGFSAANEDPFSGGTSKVVTVVQQADIDKAKEKLTSENEAAGKKKLLKAIPKDFIAIDSTFKQTVGDPVSTPALGEQVADGTEAKLESTTTFTIFTVDKTHIKEFIQTKSSKKLAADQKNYSIGNPFFERFTEGNPTTAKLKATTQSGPKVTEQEILEKSLGHKNGEVQALIKSINGVSTVKITPSFFWVKSVPNDSNRVKVEIKVEK